MALALLALELDVVLGDEEADTKLIVLVVGESVTVAVAVGASIVISLVATAMDGYSKALGDGLKISCHQSRGSVEEENATQCPERRKTLISTCLLPHGFVQ